MDVENENAKLVEGLERSRKAYCDKDDLYKASMEKIGSLE